MKNTESFLQVRMSLEEKRAIQAACKAVKQSLSNIARQTCVKLVAYIQRACPTGEWRPPVFVTEREAERLAIYDNNKLTEAKWGKNGMDHPLVRVHPLLHLPQIALDCARLN